PPGCGRDSTLECMAAAAANDELRLGIASVRCVFELRPDAQTPKGASSITAAPDSGGWTLWWRPIPATMDGTAADPFFTDPTQDAGAVALVSGLVQCQWLAFKTVTDPNTRKPKSREKLPEISAM